MLKPGLILTLLVLVAGCTSEESTSPYVGEQDRTIKALSAEDIEGYLTGQGMGWAKAAELNHYPGPKHVLALADELGLTPAQRTRTERITEQMKEKAIRLGKLIVEKEGVLDRLFAGQEAEPGGLSRLTREIGTLQGELRFAHLEAHLRMKDVLTDEQVAHYDQVRGYDATAPPGQQHDHDGMAH